MAAALFALPTAPAVLPVADGRLESFALTPGDGDRFRRVEFTCWVPDPARPVRAVIIHQHGCGNVAPGAHPPVAIDFHWRALARRHDCALLVPQYEVAGACDEWNDPASGSERALFAALAEFARRCGRPELADAPWVLWGHSGGSSWSAQMMVRHPGRVLAASFRGGCHKQFGAPEFRAQFRSVARELPLIFIWGQREAVPASRHYVSWEPMNIMYRELRAQGSPVARVIDPRSEHGCDDSRLIIIPFFDAVLDARIQKLPLPGALRDLSSFEEREVTSANLRDPALTWLPTPAVARLWREFCTEGTLRPRTPPSMAPLLHAALTPEGSLRLTWRIEPELAGGLRAIRLHRDGTLWKELGVPPGVLLATNRDSPPAGLRESSLIDDTVLPGATHTYTLTFLDAALNESPPSSSAVVRGPERR